MSESIFSTSVKGGGKTYFFDVKQAQKGKQSKYVQVTESSIQQDGQRFRNSIVVFPEQLEEFVDAFKQASEQVK